MEESIDPPSALSVQPFILAGGRSSRFGGDKALTEVGGVRQVDRLAAMLGEHFTRPAVLLCGEETAARHPGRSVVLDAGGSRGPASGLAAALEHLAGDAGPEWALLVPCDLYAWGVELAEGFLSGWRPPADAAFFSVAGRLCPLPSLWHRRRAAFARRLALSEDRSIARAAAGDALAQVLVRDDLAPRLRSFNTPEELKELRKAEG